MLLFSHKHTSPFLQPHHVTLNRNYTVGALPTLFKFKNIYIVKYLSFLPRAWWTSFFLLRDKDQWCKLSFVEWGLGIWGEGGGSGFTAVEKKICLKALSLVFGQLALTNVLCFTTPHLWPFNKVIRVSLAIYINFKLTQMDNHHSKFVVRVHHYLPQVDKQLQLYVSHLPAKVNQRFWPVSLETTNFAHYSVFNIGFLSKENIMKKLTNHRRVWCLNLSYQSV